MKSTLPKKYHLGMSNEEVKSALGSTSTKVERFNPFRFARSKQYHLGMTGDEVKAALEGGGGGGGYTEIVIANASVTLTNAVNDIPFVDGADITTPAAWTVKVDDVELTYNTSQNNWQKQVNGTTYAIKKWGGHDGWVLQVYTGSAYSPTIVAGTYAVEIKSLPTTHISANGQIDVADYSMVSVEVNPTFRSRTVTIINSAESTESIIPEGAIVYESSGKDWVNSVGGSIAKGTQQTYRAYVDNSQNAIKWTFRSYSFLQLEISGIDSSRITYSADHTMAMVYFNADNMTITIKAAAAAVEN